MTDVARVCRCTYRGAPFAFKAQVSRSAGISVIMHSIVSNKPAIEAAFCSAMRVTFVGSTTPAFTRSSYSPVATLYP